MEPTPAAAAEHEIERSLWASQREGVTSQVTLGVLDYYLIPFALFLGASSQQIGLLVALPNLLSAVSQFFVVDVLRVFGNRRRLLLWAVALQTVVLLPLPALAFLDVPGRVEALFAVNTAFHVIGAIMGPPWGSLMSDYLPETRRGDYFGRRSQAIGISGMASAGAFGLLLYKLKPLSPVAAFVVVFLAGCVFRAFSLRYMRMLVNLPEHHTAAESFDWRGFKERLLKSNFARFVVYVAAVTFSAQLSAAYLSVHMLRDLHFDYIRYTAVQLASAAAGFLTFPIWGRHADRFGNARVLRLNSLLLPVVPFLWCCSERFWGLGLVEVLGGFLWAGFNLCATNLIYEAVPPEKRVRALGYYNLINGAALFSGGALGGWLADKLPPFWGFRLHSLFLLAAMARLAADFVLAPHFEEPRRGVPHASSLDLFFSVVGLRPLIGPNLELEWETPKWKAQPTRK